MYFVTDSSLVDGMKSKLNIFHNVSRSRRFKKMIFRKHSDSTTIQVYPALFQLIQHVSNMFQKSFEFIRIYLGFKMIRNISGSQRFYWDTTILCFRVFWKRSRLKIVLDPPQLIFIYIQFVCPHPFQHVQHFGLPKSWDM